jgi:hypothetical protein
VLDLEDGGNIAIRNVMNVYWNTGYHVTDGEPEYNTRDGEKLLLNMGMNPGVRYMTPRATVVLPTEVKP